MTDQLHNTIRERRRALGWSQSDLATRVGVSRQSMNAIEAGRQVPATTLALALAREFGCAVEDLFGRPSRGSIAARGGGDVQVGARVIVGRVDGAWVAHPLDVESRAAGGVVVGPRLGEVDDRDGDILVDCLVPASTFERNVLVAGCAPLIGLLTSRANAASHGASWIPANSTRALDLLRQRRVHIAGLHLAGEGGDHASLIRRAFPGEPMTVVHLTRWQQGIGVAPGNPLGVRASDGVRDDVRWAVRELGAGARIMFDAAIGRPDGRALAASSHQEVANLIRWDVADAGIVIESVARSCGLAFLPIAEERFDLVVPTARLSSEPVEALLASVSSSGFRREVEHLHGYDVSASGDVARVS